MFNEEFQDSMKRWCDTDNPYLSCVIDRHTAFIEERSKNRKLRASMLKLKKLCEDNPDVVPLLASDSFLSRDIASFTEKLDPDSKANECSSKGKASAYYCGRYTQDHVLGCLRSLFENLAGPITYFGSSTLRPPSFGKARPVPNPGVIGQQQTSDAILALKPKFLGDIHPAEEFKRVAESLRVHHKGYALKFFADNAPALLNEAMKWKIPQDPDDIEPVVFDSTPVLGAATTKP